MPELPQSVTLAYGDDPDQWSRCRISHDEKCGTAILVHGGYWREQYTADLMTPIAEDLARRGWATVNVEYRRGPQAVWPTPLEDVRSACTAAHSWAQARGVAGPLIGIGHSVGGQLALLAGAPLGGVVALAPVTDVLSTFAQDLGEGAALEYFGATPTQAPSRYVEASPISQLPIGRPTLLVHGADDSRVPVQHTLSYLEASLESGDSVSAEILDQLGHLDAIDPGAEHWASVVAWMDRLAKASLAGK